VVAHKPQRFVKSASAKSFTAMNARESFMLTELPTLYLINLATGLSALIILLYLLGRTWLDGKRNHFKMKHEEM